MPSRTRSRSYDDSVMPYRYWTYYNSSSGTGGTLANDYAHNQANPTRKQYARSETIIDQVSQKRDRHELDRLKRKFEVASRIADVDLRRSVQADLYTSLVQVHPCYHTLKRIDLLDNMVIKGQHASYSVLQCNLQCFGGSQLESFMGLNFNSSKSSAVNLANSSGGSYSASSFATPDWFALLDKWQEMCNNILPSSSLLGESMVENAIFVDAFKTVLNPSYALKAVLKRLKGVLKPTTRLGQIRKATRELADANLFYHFGVLPAIGEVKNMLSAHQKVRSRISFLQSNAGGYVPVRARQVLPCSITNNAVNSITRLCDRKDTVACISALAKVRPDIDYQDEWKAYIQYFGLHKFIGLAWELIPFSFVVDWITNAGDYIDKYTRPNFASPFYNIRNICHSTKTTLQESIWLPQGYYIPSIGYNVTNGPVKLATLTSSTYQRDPGLPQSSGGVDFSLLGSFHALIGSSLLIQKLLK